MGTATWAPHARGGCCHSAVPKADDYGVFWGCFLPAGGGTGVEEASQVRERVLSVEGGFGAASGWASADPHSGEIGSLVY